MASAKNIVARRKEIEDLLALFDLEQAVKRYIDFAREFEPRFLAEAVLCSQEFHNSKRDPKEERARREQQLTISILSALDVIIQSKPEGFDIPEPPDNIVLLAKDLEKRYDSAGFSFQIDALELRLGQIAGLVGENATGKTTLLRLLAGDLAADKGTLKYPLFDPEEKYSWPAIKQQIAYVPQELPHWHGSLEENLRFEASLHGVRGDANRKAVDYIVQRLDLAEHMDKTWTQLSGGYKLRFALAKALVWNARLLILDEPLAYLDVKAQLAVLEDLKNVVESAQFPLSILLSSQHLHEVEAVADQMLFMREGSLENLGPTVSIGADRIQNVFEFGCSLGVEAFESSLDGFPACRVLKKGATYLVYAPLELNGNQLLEHFAARQIAIHYYRDISRSIKTRFYENPA